MIFAFNDVAAIGALSAAADVRAGVPTELSLVGDDDTHLARIRHISLTSVDNGDFAVGVQTGIFLSERLAAPPNLPWRTHSMPTRLNVHGSTGPNPEGDEADGPAGTP